jgi:SpoVK/Ycf46/Vps4 family AAA+-type ATPase
MLNCTINMLLHVSTMHDLQVEKAPLESYADVGGLEQQVQEIKEAVELPLTNPELYEDIGIKPPKVRHSMAVGFGGWMFEMRLGHCGGLGFKAVR